MIIIGYPGIGKSSVASVEHGIIDLESSLFHNRLEDLNGASLGWEKKYCNVAIDLSLQGYTVCVSSHDEVRSYLESHKDDYLGRAALIYPDPSLRDSWIKRLYDRYYEERKHDTTKHWIVEKNYRAVKHVEVNYDADIQKMRDSSLAKYEIKYIPYDLMDVIRTIKTHLFREGG